MESERETRAPAASCCAELAAPGIFLSPFLDERYAGIDQLARFDHVELEALLPHATLLVHHGGLGTTARALQAGIPQVISPIGFDQPDNGHRVEVLRAGRVVQRDQMSGPAFAAAVRELLQNAEVKPKLSHYRMAISKDRAVERCANLLEHVACNTPVLCSADRGDEISCV